MKALLSCLAGFAVLLSACSEPAPPEAPEAAEAGAAETHTSGTPDVQAEIEAGLYPAVMIEGEVRPSLAERMAHFNAPQVSVAVWRDGALDWAEGYGEGADADTLFQAASLSKAVSAVGITALAFEKGITLDADISGDLEGVDLAALNPEGVPITLRGLLSHTNGATVGGFGGYPAGSDVPGNLEVVTGSDRTNSDPVRIEANPDGAFSYAGGGYQLAQLWAETVSGEDFETLMQRLVLQPAGMTRSTFAQPLPDDLASGNVAPAYEGDGSPVEGGWHTYPEQAAAGLWTTPTDYARFVDALIKAMKGETGTGVSPEIAAAVTSAVSDGYGLGIGVEEKDGGTVLRHSGSNKGYKTYFEAWPERGDAVVVMTGAEAGFPLNADIVRTAKRIYGWPVGPQVVKARVPVEAAALRALEGDYVLSGAERPRFTLTASAPDLVLETANGGRYTLVPIGEQTFIDPDDGQEVVFEPAEDGTMTARTGETVFERTAGPEAPEDSN